MRIFKKIHSMFFPKRICGKTWIEESMTAKYGPDWLDQCLNGLKDSETRRGMRETLNLGEYSDDKK